jgi:hypothetical protein
MLLYPSMDLNLHNICTIYRKDPLEYDISHALFWFLYGFKVIKLVNKVDSSDHCELQKRSLYYQ